MLVSLNVVITGGSGLVPGLREEIREAVNEALKAREFSPSTIHLSTDHIPRLSFRDESEYARRAVSLGAADYDKPGLHFQEKMEPPIRVKVETGPSWV